MDAKLLHAVRARMESSPTEDLLRLWTDNDREHYSEEAFEAMRLILTARGVTLPQQRQWTGPIPVANKAITLDPSSHEFWNAWLRPLLWAAIVVGIVRCLYLAIWAAEMLRTNATFSWPTVYSFSSLVEAVQSGLDFILPPTMLVGAYMSLRLKPVGRLMLLVWGWTEAASCVVATVHYAVVAMFGANDMLHWASWTLYEAHGNVTLAAFSLVVVHFITRPQITRLFDVPSYGFDLSTSPPVYHTAGESVLTAAKSPDQPPRPPDHQRE